jgi:excisionase family DNA binding protein
VEVRYGVYLASWPVAGWTVGAVKLALSSCWNVGYFAEPWVNGRISRTSDRLRPGDQLAFLHRAGRKGADDAADTEAGFVWPTFPEFHSIAERVLAMQLDRERSIEAALGLAARFIRERFGLPEGEDREIVREIIERVAAAVQRIEARLSLSGPAGAAEIGAETGRERTANGVTSPYLLAGEAATYLRTTVQTIYDWVKDGKLRPEPGITGRLLFARESLDRFARTPRRR